MGADGISSAYVALEADASFAFISISVIYRGNPIYRLDIVPPDRDEGNIFSARKYAKHLPPEFSGSHTHTWEDHRLWIADHGLGELPFRRPLEPAPDSFARAFDHVAEAINLTLLSAHRPIELPRQIGFSVKGGKA